MTALNHMLALWCFLQDLTDRKVLIVWEDSAMDRAMRQLTPMCEHCLTNPETEIAAQQRAAALLGRLPTEGLYR